MKEPKQTDTMKQKIEGGKTQLIKIKEKIVFEFTHYENAERVALALCSSGYFVKITTDVLSKVYVYTYDH